MIDNTEMPHAVPIIDHVGIAVNSLESALPRWTAIMGGPPTGDEIVASEMVRVAFFGDGHGRVELLEPTDPDSPIARHLDRRGEGIHHVCLSVNDLESALVKLAAEGAEPIPPGVRPGAGGARVAFVHPKSMGGVLLELREAPPEP